MTVATTYNKDNLNAEDLPKILRTFSLDQKDLDMICDEYSCWSGLLMDSISKQETFLENQKAHVEILAI